jgi:hypothetical protein
MIFDGTKIKQYDSKRGLDMITYPVDGGEDSNALAFMKVISVDALREKISFDMSVIYVDIIENPPGAPLSDAIEELFFNNFNSLDLLDLQNATSAQKRGLEPIAENIFSSEDPVGAYNRFQDLIYEYEQKKKEEKDGEAVALVVKKSEDFKNIYPYTSKNNVGPLLDKFTGLVFDVNSPKTYVFIGNTEKLFPRNEAIYGLFVMTDEDNDIFYLIPTNKSKGEDQNGDSGQGDPDGNGKPGGDGKSGDDGKPGKGKPSKGKPDKGEPGDPGKGEPGIPGGGEPNGGEPGGAEPGGSKPSDGNPSDDGEPVDKVDQGGGQRSPKDNFDQEILRISEAIGVRPVQVAASFTSDTRARSLLSGGNFEKLNEPRTMSEYIGYVRSIM